ncbi:PepSY-associated TM helix domain-containing protein [Sphingomonas sp. LT1P40]|uniref:PepSY-associated TM helix domain-containing protein n=1 Tax=Alteristakelama amylovorans TaxID=3096166 RepID=UPI002FC97126
MPDSTETTQRTGIAVKALRWLGVVAALIWLVQAVTGILLAYYFELNDTLLSSVDKPKDFAAIEQRMDDLAGAGGKAKINWIWSTAGRQDRFFLNYTAPDGGKRDARIAGDGTVLLDTSEGDLPFLERVREIHLTLSAGKTGEWILTITSLLLLGNLIHGIYTLWPRRERWGEALKPRRATGDRLEAWYRAIGLVGVIPTFVVVAAATVIFFEHSIEGPIGAPPIKLAAVAPAGENIGFAAAARAAEAAIPGSRFVGGPMPTAEDATWKLWVNQPGEYFRENGYGGSLVLIDGNDGTTRGAFPLQQASAAYKFMALPYPIHTGEIAGPIGRFLVLLVGLWLATMTIIGLILWNRRRKAAV